MLPEIVTSAAEAMDTGLQAVGGVFSGITSFIANNWFFAVLMIIPLIGIGIGIFKKVVSKFGK